MSNFAWLGEKAKNIYSQGGEDGVVGAILEVIQPANRWCFECGAHDGLFFSNTRRLIRDGWDALLIEADHDAFRRLTENCAEFGPRVRRVCERVECLDPYLAHFGAPTDLDLAVIDVDGQDYYLFNSLLEFRPRVMIVEFDHNADPDYIPEFGGAGQAGWRAIARLGAGKFYTVVWKGWCNLILVKQPLERLLDIR